jgi:hypothetical protein
MPFDGLETPFGHLAQFDQLIDLIEAPGQWVKHTYRTANGRYCLKEALNMVGAAEILEPVILKAADEVMARQFCCIESFNDHPQTSYADVMTVLHRARANLVAATTGVPATGLAKLAVRWNEYKAPAGTATSLWQKLFSWT